MESIGCKVSSMDQSPLRFKVVIGKFPVIKVEQAGPRAMTWWVELPNRVIIQVTGPIADVRENDLLTFYTEVLANAHPSLPSIQ